MDAIVTVSWETYAAWALVAAGSPLFIAGLAIELDGITRPLRDPAKVLTWVRGFRLSMVGLALAGYRRRLAARSDLARCALPRHRR